MRIYNRDVDLPVKVKKGEKTTDFICPNCKAEYAKEVNPGILKITCPNCHYKWRVDTQGRPTSLKV